MGGKLFNLPRMPRAQYLAVEAEVRGYLDQALLGAYRIPRYYGDKPDFGDMDVIVPSRPDWDQVRARIVSDLGITQVRPTGHVFSTVFRGLQTDFFTVPERLLDSAYNYMSFNDLGNFIGRICRRFNLKYGERGLSYVYRRADGHYKVDLDLTTDFARICAFLGLDHARWVAGFPSLPSMFEWVLQSPYFSVAPYLDDTEGHMRGRQEARTTVARFVAYLRDQGIDRRPPFADRASYLPLVIAAFPEVDLAAQIAREQDLERRHALLKERFSGKRVAALRPGLAGEALGTFIAAFRRSFPDFEAFLLESPQEEIDRRILAFNGAEPQA